MNTFFVSTPLGFEEVALSEMKEVWPYLLAKDAKTHDLPFPEVKVLQGGFEFQSEMFTGLQLNFFLKTAGRILLRMAVFKARDLPKFYGKMRALPWLEFLAHANVEWEVSAQKSRINNEKRLQDAASEALNEIFKDVQGPTPCGSIYIRMFDDNCTISLDTTGEHLHKRGASTLKGEAPLRETIAAFLLRAMIENETPADLEKITLMDPMVGSGTFLTEGRTMGAGQFTRKFAFQDWKRAPKLFLSPAFAFNYELPARKGFGAYKGNDIDPKMKEVAEKNFAELERQLAAYQRKSFVKADISISTVDSLKNLEKSVTPTWMIVNPPYGERLDKAAGGMKINELAERLCKFGTPQKLGILFPENLPLTVAPIGFKVLKEIKINNGGIRCLFTVLTSL